MTLGHFFILNEKFDDQNLTDKRGKAYLIETMSQLRNIFGCDSPETAFRYWYDFLDRCGLKVNLSELEIVSNDIKKILAGINADRLSNNPIKIRKTI